METRTFNITTEQQRAVFAVFVTRQRVPFAAEIGPEKKKRTIPANRRLWLLHTAASEVCGYTPNECHEEMLCACYGYTVEERKNPWTGEIESKKIPNQRSHDKDTKGFAKFMDFCENFYGSTLAVWLP